MRHKRTKTTTGLTLAATAALVVALLSSSSATSEAGTPRPECPATLKCQYVPAAYELTDPADQTSYGNYDVADRPRTTKIDTIVLHDTEESYDDTIKEFQDPSAVVSAHYVVRSGDGLVTQMVPTKDIAWQAGNWYTNTQSIGIEQEGFAAHGSEWFTPALYKSTARLVKYLAAKYHIPLDRQHILGHENVPGPTASSVPGMHWDPGPYWDWDYFFTLLGKPFKPTAAPGSRLVTFDPVFKRNIQQTRDCEGGVDLPAQPAGFLPLHTAPSDDSPLFSDPGLHPDGTAGTNCASDWGDKASTGSSFSVAERRGDWTAIWWAGSEAWFKSPKGVKTTVPSKGWVVRPKAGRSEVPTYGRAYPEASAYPADIPVQSIEPLPYTIKAGQSYASTGAAPTGYYYAKTIDDSLAGDHTYVAGKDKYLTVQIGHRIAYVNAADVDLVKVG
jgi:N-acetyl-anhydromuramyl-L-alanine amidase AmpD